LKSPHIMHLSRESRCAALSIDHHRRRLEHRVGDLSNAKLLVVGLLRRDDRRVRREHEVDTFVRSDLVQDSERLH